MVVLENQDFVQLGKDEFWFVVNISLIASLLWVVIIILYPKLSNIKFKDQETGKGSGGSMWLILLKWPHQPPLFWGLTKRLGRPKAVNLMAENPVERVESEYWRNNCYKLIIRDGMFKTSTHRRLLQYNGGMSPCSFRTELHFGRNRFWHQCYLCDDRRILHGHGNVWCRL